MIGSACRVEVPTPPPHQKKGSKLEVPHKDESCNLLSTIFEMNKHIPAKIFDTF